MAAELHVGDIGTEILVTLTDQDGTAVDVSSASTLTILARKPDGTVIEWTATAGPADPDATPSDGSDGAFHYLTTDGDLDAAGLWRFQGYVVVGSGEWHTDTRQERVHPNLG